MMSGNPTTASTSSTAMTRKSLNRSAAFQVNPAMAKIFCIESKRLNRRERKERKNIQYS